MNSKTKIQEKNRMCEIDDHIFKYFEIKRRLGKGAYGIVWKALHRKTNQTVAVKKIFDAFRDETDAQRTFREIMFLRAFRDHPCIIQLHNVYKASNNLDIYLSFEFMESDLHNVIKKGNVLKDVHKRYIFYQLLNAISYIHSGNVIHRDLKPSNVLIDTKCNCKLADFGLARSVSNQQMRDATIDANESLEPMLTDYVATRWYRAPEILIASKRYTKGIDMWSLGCILGEMIRGKPIFQGNSTVDQIEKIVSALPQVTEKDIISVGAGFGSALLSKTIPGKSTTTLDELLIDGANDANDLVKRLLVLDPMARLTAIESLGHKYVERFQDRIELIELNADVKPPFHDDIRLSVNEYRSKLYEIIQQTEKSTNNGKSYSLTRKREPSRTVINKSTDIIPSNLNTYEEKLKRNACRSQECKPYLSNDVTSQSKATISRASNKVKVTPPPPHMITANNGIYRNPKKQITSSLINDHHQPDSKIDAVLSKSKYSMQTSVRNGQSATSKNTSSSPELVGIQRFNSKSNMVVMEKRHSIDGSYNYVQPSNRLVSQTNQPAEKEKSVAMFSSHNNSHHLTNRHREKSKISTSGFPKSYQNINAYHDNQIVSSPSNKKSVPPSSTEDLTMLNDGSNYYVKRLKRLEEQIEKHKKEVKAFCSENSKNCKAVPSHKRQSGSNVEQKITYKDKYYVNGNGNGISKALQFHPKTDANNSSKYYAKQSSSGRFDYLFVNDDHINHREAIVSKYGDKRPTKIM